MKKKILTFVLSVITALVFLNMPFTDGNDTVIKAEAATSTIDSKTWVDFWCMQDLNGYRYGYEMIIGSDGAYTGKYKLFQQNSTTGKTKKLCSLTTKSHTGRFVTNGKEILNIEDMASGGARVDVLDMAGNKLRTIADQRKYATSQSIDSYLNTYIYNGYLYFSKYRGLGDYIYKIYKVNIKTGKGAVVSSDYILENYGKLPVYSRYVPVKAKNGACYMFDLVKKTTVKLGGTDVRRWKVEGKYFYTLHAKKASGGWKYTVKKRKMNGTAVSTVGTFTAKYNPDQYAGFTSKGINFYTNGSKYYQYTFKTKKARLTSDPLYHEGYRPR